MIEQLSPPVTSTSCFAQRRSALAKRLDGAGIRRAAFCSGWSRPRNFAHNVYAFRAESHFLFLVGKQLEGSVLLYDDGKFSLGITAPEADAALWEGPSLGAREWAEITQLPVFELDSFQGAADYALLPPQDEESALWLGALLGREVEPQSGPDLAGADSVLAQAMVESRLHHDEDALNQMRFAAEVTALAHRAGMGISPGASTEAEVRGQMEGHLIARGLCPAYTSIVTAHGEILHASQSRGPLNSGDLILSDVGGETVEGYAADITRTWPKSGHFSSTQAEIYSLVLQIQKKAISSVSKGSSYRELHRQAHREMGQGLVQLGILKGQLDTLIELGAVGLFFPHGLGHLLGLDVHDMEDLGTRAGFGDQSPSSDPAESSLRLVRDLAPGMVVTIEPGFYQVPLLLERARADSAVNSVVSWNTLSKFSDVRGIRIEDDVLVTDAAPEVLSKNAPKEIDDLREAIGAG